MKKVIIVLLAAVMAALCASCGEEEKPAAKDDSVVIQITSREAQGHDEINIKEETVEIKGKNLRRQPNPTTLPNRLKKRRKRRKIRALATFPHKAMLIQTLMYRSQQLLTEASATLI